MDYDSVDAIRADSAFYAYEIIKSMERYSARFFVKARMTDVLERAVGEVAEWSEVKGSKETLLRGSARVPLFLSKVRGNKEKTESLKVYRIVVTKVKKTRRTN